MVKSLTEIAGAEGLPTPSEQQAGSDTFELADQAIVIGANAIKDLVTTNLGTDKLAEELNRQLDFWVKYIAGAGFVKGTLLAAHRQARYSFSSLDHPEGYPT